MNSSSHSSFSTKKIVAFFTSKTMTYVGFALVALLSFALARQGYRWFDARRQSAAQEVLMGVIAQLSVAEKEEKTDWNAVGKIIDTAYEQTKNTNAAAPLLALRADVYSAQQEHEKALDAMNQVVALSPNDSIITPLYAIKRALMRIDADEQTRQLGLQELETLAQQKHNQFADQARYYWGMYYAVAGNEAQAQEILKPLLDVPFDGEGGSVWAARARDTLNIA